VAPITGTFNATTPTIYIDYNVTIVPAPITGTFSLPQTFDVEQDSELGVSEITGEFNLLSFNVGQNSWHLGGNYTWTCPPNINYITVKLWGGGGDGGAGASGGGGGGGGGGQYAVRSMNVTPGYIYSLHVGYAGDASWFVSFDHTRADGGDAGSDADADFPGNGGAGGTSGAGDTLVNGYSGEVGTSTDGGDGGDSPYGGAGGDGGPAGYSGDDGNNPGGGAGGGGLGESGGAGADGAVVIEGASLMSPGVVSGTFSLLSPTVIVTRAATVTPDPITGLFSLPTAGALINVIVVTPDPISGLFSTIDPTASGDKYVTVTPAPITGKFSLIDANPFEYAKMWVKRGSKWKLVS